MKEQEIRAIVVTDNGYFEYSSPTDKSDSLRAKSVLINPTSYWIYPRLVKIEENGQEIKVDFSGNDNRHNWTVVSGKGSILVRDSENKKFSFCDSNKKDFSALTNDAEVEQGTYRVVFDLYESGAIQTVGIHSQGS